MKRYYVPYGEFHAYLIWVDSCSTIRHIDSYLVQENIASDFKVLVFIHMFETAYLATFVLIRELYWMLCEKYVLAKKCLEDNNNSLSLNAQIA